MMSDDELERLREQTSQGDRIDEEADSGDQQQFVDDIVAELEAIERGDEQKTVSVWDGPLAAFVRALEANPDRMQELGEALEERLDVDEAEIGRSEVIRLALQLGFQEADPEAFDAVREAVKEHATQRL